MIIPRNDLVLVEKQDKKLKTTGSGIVIPAADTQSKFIKVKVLAFGPKVEGLEIGDIVLVNDIVEIINSEDPNVGLINDKYIHARIS